MKAKMIFTAMTLLLVLTLGFYVFAQSKTKQDLNNAREISDPVVVVGTGVGPAKTAEVVVLCKSDGSILDQSFPRTGTLRVEYKNGSFSQIDLGDVKKITVTAQPGR